MVLLPGYFIKQKFQTAEKGHACHWNWQSCSLVITLESPLRVEAATVATQVQLFPC